MASATSGTDTRIAAALKDCEENIYQGARELGFDSIMIVSLSHINLTAKCLGNFPPGFLKEYETRQLHHSDKSLALCQATHTPVTWREAFADSQSEDNPCCPYKLSLDYGLQNTVAIPTFHPKGSGVINFSLKGNPCQFERIWSHKRIELIGFSQLVFWNLASLFPHALFEQPKLTGKETECLSFISKGLNNQEASQIMGVSRDRVKELVSNLIRKLNAANRTEAVMIASKTRLI